ncbi:hypothetical protein MIMGU_mgv1a018324mg [Erythranthe guttata]|uniref:Uncharacterized protein n=1 Tax=Erythranthe guttata TaxID=4155 RepID=A0A022QK69_ERYGU|nr:hypothetical protein MIMGU_mgv1a018324mg [Erythranthe guttata]
MSGATSLGKAAPHTGPALAAPWLGRKLNLARWLSGPFSQISRIAPKTSGATSFCPRLLAPWAESPAPWLGRCRKSENFQTRKK